MRSKAFGEVTDGKVFRSSQLRGDSCVYVGLAVTVDTGVKELERVGGEIQIIG